MISPHQLPSNISLLVNPAISLVQGSQAGRNNSGQVNQGRRTPDGVVFNPHLYLYLYLYLIFTTYKYIHDSPILFYFVLFQVQSFELFLSATNGVVLCMYVCYVCFLFTNLSFLISFSLVFGVGWLVFFVWIGLDWIGWEEGGMDG
jgi:hypothetical protein